MNARPLTFLLAMAAAIASVTVGCGKERPFRRVEPLLGDGAAQADAGVAPRARGDLETNQCGVVMAPSISSVSEERRL
jgi:hypothetical protein